MTSDAQTSAGRDAWFVGVDTCDIEERGEGDIRSGQRVQFSLGIRAPGGLRLVADPLHRRQALHAVHAAYDVAGVVTRLEGGMVIDFGVEAVVVHDHEMRFRVGQGVEGRVALGLHVSDGDAIRIPNRVPSQPYHWRVEQVLRCSWNAGLPPDLAPVPATTVEADAGEGYYILRCRLEH